MVDRGDHRGPCSALHHPHFHGPADYSCHHQQEGAQTQSKALSCAGFVVIMASVTGSVTYPERLRVPPGPVHGGAHAGRVLFDGLALVRGSHRSLHHPRQQLEARIGVFSSRGAAKVSGDQRTANHGPHDLHPHGLLGLHDVCAEGQGDAGLTGDHWGLNWMKSDD